ncbi:hypothetical protein [Streptomyces regalis]|uniref:hypothetical protein n=1 Tax=Streptomyces regalis TaxID=68262 RepID=UPI000A665B69|nr:hypothetical protein [Streptomyces regalis]
MKGAPGFLGAPFLIGLKLATVPTFSSWTAGEKPTAAKFTTNIKDAGNFFKNTPFAWAYQGTGTNTVSDGAWNNVVLDTEKFDNDNMFTAGTPQLTIRTPGLYCIEGGVRFTNSQNGIRGCRIRVNGVDANVNYLAASVNTSHVITVRPTTYVQCVANDVITVDAHVNGAGTASPWTSSVALNISSTLPYYNFLRARWVAA